MAQVVVERVHALESGEVRVRAERLASRLAEKYGVRSYWEEDVLMLEQTGISGRIETFPDSVRIIVSLGLLLRPMQGMLKSEIERVLDKYLAP